MIGVLIVGLLVGIVAKFIMPGRQPRGLIMTLILGVAGAMVASWAGDALGIYHVGEPVGFFAAVLGAMALLFVYGMVGPKVRN